MEMVRIIESNTVRRLAQTSPEIISKTEKNNFSINTNDSRFQEETFKIASNPNRSEEFLESGGKSSKYRGVILPSYYVSMGLVCLMVHFSLVFAVIMRCVLLTSNISIDINAPQLICGILLGLCCRLGKTNFLIDFPLLQSFTMYFIVVPIMLYKMCFYSDLQGLQKNIFQTLLISGPGLVLHLIFVGITTRYLLAKEWSFVGCVIFGTACVVIYPRENITKMRVLGSQPQHISILLEGETIFGTLVAFGLYTILPNGFVSYLSTTQDVLDFFIRYFLGGIIAGFIFGKINCLFFWSLSSNVADMILFSTAMPLVAYYVCSFIIGTSGLMAIVICGLMMASKRDVLNKSSKVLLRKYWDIISLTLESITSTLIGARIGYKSVWFSNYLDYVRIVLIYCATYCGRFIIYAILAPLTSRVGYGMNFRCLVVAVWSGVPSLANICFAILPWNMDESTKIVVPTIFFYVSGMVIMSLMLNVSTLSPLLKFLQMEAVCATRETEIRWCMEHLRNVQVNFVICLKVEKLSFINNLQCFSYTSLMGETSWESVETATTLKDPFEKDSKNNEETDLNEYVTYCLDCNQEINVPPNYTEYSKLKGQANLRFLKARETMLIHNFSKGLISENSFKTLSSMISRAYDHPKNKMKMDHILKLFKTEIECTRINFKYPNIPYLHIEPHEFPSIPPNFYWRRLCYHIVKTHNFHLWMLGILSANMAWILIQFCVDLAPSSEANYANIVFDLIFAGIYTSECLVNIAARSVKSFWKDGLKNYFRSKYSTFDFCILITVWISFAIESLFYTSLLTGTILYEHRIWFTLFKSVRFLRMFEYCIYSKMVFVRILDSWKNRRLLNAYEIGKDFWILEKRFLDEMVPLLCDDFRMRRDFRAEIERNLCDTLHELQKVQHDNFSIAVTVKTKYAVKLTVGAMVDTVHKLMVSGWIDNMEQAALDVKLSALTNKCKCSEWIKDNNPEKIFRNVPWLKHYPRSKILLKEAETKVFNSGEILFEEDAESEGIYVITSGTCNVFYVPNEERLMRLDRYGELPVLDNITSNNFERVITDNSIMAGMTLGELCFLTGRSYAATVTVDFPMRAYFISSAVLRRVMEGEQQQNDGLECRLWKHVSKNLTRSMLHQRELHDERLFCTRSLTQIESFLVQDSIENVVLIEGIIQDAVSGNSFKAPCIIPRCVKKIIYPENVVIARILLIFHEESQAEYGSDLQKTENFPM